MKKPISAYGWEILRYIVIAAFLFMIAIPLFWMFCMSIKEPRAQYVTPMHWLPEYPA